MSSTERIHYQSNQTYLSSETSSDSSRDVSPEADDNDGALPDQIHAVLPMAATENGLYLCYQVAAPFSGRFCLGIGANRLVHAIAV